MTMDRAMTLTDMLKSRSLLLEGYQEGTIKMHDVTRDTALHIASKGEFNFLVKKYHQGRINDVTNDGMLSEKHAISVTSRTSMVEFFQHNDVMKYPNLHILRLHGLASGAYDDPLPHKFPICFFEGMGNLKVLEMWKVGISSFPTSLGSLKMNLRTMCLHYCTVEDISEVGELINLEILDVRHSTIRGGLYAAIQRLIGLRVLDLAFCCVNEFVDNLVGCHPRLEGLYMLGIANIDRSKPIITSLVGLETSTHLEVLRLQVGRPEQLTDKFLSILGRLFSFEVCLSDTLIDDMFGVYTRRIGEYKILTFKQVTANKHLQQCLGQLLRIVDKLQLEECNSFAPIIFCYEGEYFSNLRSLKLKSCVDVEFVINGQTMKPELRHDDQIAPFAMLEELSLLELSGLKAICAPSQQAYLSKLKRLSIRGCGILPYVFTKSVARQLQQLEHFTIARCGEMEEIFTADNNTSGSSSSSDIMDEVNSIFLPSLQHLSFVFIPKLKLFAAENRSHGARSAFFGEQVHLPELKELFLFFLPSCETIWESHPFKSSFCQLRLLDIGDCMELRYIFSAEVARGLVQLKELYIHGCDKLEEVVVIESGNDDDDDEQQEGESKITFPRIDTISLINLRSLRSFCSGTSYALEFPSLETVEMSRNYDMQRFSCGSLLTPKLHHVLWIADELDGGEEFWEGDLNTTVFHLFEEGQRKLVEEIIYTKDPSIWLVPLPELSSSDSDLCIRQQLAFSWLSTEEEEEEEEVEEEEEEEEEEVEEGSRETLLPILKIAIIKGDSTPPDLESLAMEDQA